MTGSMSGVEQDLFDRLLGLRQHRMDGKRSPHKPLLVLLALGQSVSTGTTALRWSEAESRLADLLEEYGRPGGVSRRQGAAYPFTRLRSDDVWLLDADVPMDLIGGLDRADPTGSLRPDIERVLRNDATAAPRVARAIVEAQFPPTVAPDLLLAVGFDPHEVFDHAAVPAQGRRRSSRWPAAIVQAWDRSCAFCGFDGQLGSGSVGLEAAHVRWFNHGGPDDLDNGLALCALHHKLFDRGAIGLDVDHTLLVSDRFTARSAVGRAVYGLHGQSLTPRPGTVVPDRRHLMWHRREVFHGTPLAKTPAHRPSETAKS